MNMKEEVTATFPVQYTEADVNPHGSIPGAGHIFSESTDDLLYAPLPWQKLGLSQTTSGYGAKLVTYYKINFCGKFYRLYNTCYGNASSTWFTVKGRRIYVS